MEGIERGADRAIARLVDALRSARPGGVRIREWSVHASETRRVVIGTRDARTGGPASPLSLAEALSARILLVWDDGRVSGGDLDRTAIEEGLAEAIERSRSSARDDPDAAHVAAPAILPEVCLLDPAAARIAAGDVAPIASRIDEVRERFRRHRFRTWSGAFHASHTGARVVTSAGFDGSSEATLFGWHVSFDGEISDGYRGRAPDTEREFGSRLDRLADYALRLRHPASPDRPAERLAILHPKVVSSLVLETLLHNLDGAAVAHGESRFPRDAFASGAKHLGESLSLRLEPTEPLQVGSYRFTHEGIPAARTTFVDRGRLVTPILGIKYARRLGSSPTGLPIAHDALRLDGPPLLSLDQALEAAAEGTLVLEVLGVHTQDPTSGDFSLSAPQALAVSSGAARGRVRVTLSGNLFDALEDEALRLVTFPGEAVPGLAIRCKVEDR